LRTHLSHIVVTAAIVLTLGARHAVAQALLGTPVSARVIAMGVSGTADNSSPSTIFLNPANVIGAPRLYAAGAMTDFNPDRGDDWMRRASGGMSCRVGKSFTLGADFSYSKMLFNATPLYIAPTELKYSEELEALALGAGYTSGNYDVLAGTTLKHWSSSDHGFSDPYDPMVETSVSDDALDLGVIVRRRATMQAWDVNWALGMAMLNEGADYRNTLVSSGSAKHYNFGLNLRLVSPTISVLSAQVPFFALTANLDSTKPRDDDWQWMGGTELAVAQILFVRTGLQTFTGSRNPDQSLACWGAGVGIPAGKLRARFDYGRRDSGFSNQVKHFELTLEWEL
jgi:hypothetical protein